MQSNRGGGYGGGYEDENFNEEFEENVNDFTPQVPTPRFRPIFLKMIVRNKQIGCCFMNLYKQHKDSV